MFITQLLKLSLFISYILHEDQLLLIVGFVCLFMMFLQNGHNLSFSTHRDCLKFTQLKEQT